MDEKQVEAFREVLRTAQHVAVMTGAGVSAESGVPTFRGAGEEGLWRQFDPAQVANPEAWEQSPGLVWEFYNYRRRVMADKLPNPAHRALADFEARMTDAGRTFDLITQNIDDLHYDGGSKNVTRLHGSIWQVRCAYCGEVTDNREVPIAEAFEGHDGPGEADGRDYQKDDLPACQQTGCPGVLRPNVVWFGEQLRAIDMMKAYEASKTCDVMMVIGTSAVVYPAIQLVPLARTNGAEVAEINLDETPMTSLCSFTFTGKAGEVLPQLFDGVSFD